MQQSVISVLTRFAAFLLTELVHASGVLSMVAAGLLISQIGPRLIPAAARVQAQSFWAVLTCILNGGLFILVGIQLFGAVEGLSFERPAGPRRDRQQDDCRALGVLTRRAHPRPNQHRSTR